MVRPWKNIDSVDTDEGLLELRQRGENDYLITIAGRVLMNSFANMSEKVLAKSACTSLHNRTSPRVLIGGLGMGCTLKAALDNLPADARVIVAELNLAIVKWCRGPLARLTGGAVNDARVTVEIADVASVIQKAANKGGDERYDAILLDLYEGPFEAARERGEYLYGTAALERSRSALMPGGMFAVWSEDPDRAFERRLIDAGFSYDRKRPGKGGSRHTVYIAKQGAKRSRRYVYERGPVSRH